MNVSQMKQMFFLAPAGKGYKPAIKDSKTDAPQTVEGPVTVYVKGANNYVAAGDETTNGGMAYDMWYVNNAAAASGSATLNITKA
jgi:ABC-type Fe3+-hydroxamate transport system substrate-binding protein